MQVIKWGGKMDNEIEINHLQSKNSSRLKIILGVILAIVILLVVLLLIFNINNQEKKVNYNFTDNKDIKRDINGMIEEVGFDVSPKLFYGDTYDSGSQGVDINGDKCQSFIANNDSNITLVGIAVKGYRAGTGSLYNVTVAKRGSHTESPILNSTNIIVYNSSWDTSQITTTTTGEWQNITFTTAPTLVNGTEYFICIWHLTADTTNKFRWRNGAVTISSANGNPSDNGKDNGGGATWSDIASNNAFVYQVYGNITLAGGTPDTERPQFSNINFTSSQNYSLTEPYSINLTITSVNGSAILQLTNITTNTSTVTGGASIMIENSTNNFSNGVSTFDVHNFAPKVCANNRGQTFTIGNNAVNATYNITKISVGFKIWSGDLPADNEYATINVLKVNATGYPNETVIANGRIRNSDIVTGYNNITIVTNQLLLPNQKYMFWVNSSGTKQLDTDFSNSLNYGGGNTIKTLNCGATWVEDPSASVVSLTAGSGDLWFAVYGFNSTTDTNITTYITSSQNFSMSNTSSFYNISFLGLPIGNYSFKIFAWGNGTSNLTNMTSSYNFTIGSPSLPYPSMAISISPYNPVENGTETNVTAYGCPIGETCNFTRNGVQISNPDISNLSIGSYIYNYSFRGSESYYPLEVITTLEVNPSSYGGSIGNVTFTEGRLSVERNFLVPYHFVTNARMNLSSLSYTNNTLINKEWNNTLASISVSGITNNNTNLFILNKTSSLIPTIMVYNTSLSYKGNININYTEGGLFPSLNGITTNNTNFWIIDNNRDMLIKYLSNGTYVANVSLGTSVNPTDLTNNNTNIYITDSLHDTILIYDLNLNYVSNFTLNINNANAQGIWFYNNSIQVSDDNTDYIYIYNLDGTYNSNYSIAQYNINQAGATSLGDDVYMLSTETGLDMLYKFNYKVYPSNINITINGNSIYSYPNLFNQTNNRTNNFYQIMNNYLSTCTFVGIYCIVPVNFSSASIGILYYSDVQINNDGFIEYNQSFTNSIQERRSSTFSINISYDSNAFTPTGVLYYNNTPYSGTKTGSGNNVIYSVNAISPDVNSTTNVSFYWRIALSNSSTTSYYYSNSYNQSVTPIFIDDCSSFTSIMYNFSIKDEQTRNLINATNNLTQFEIDLRLSPLGATINPFLTYSRTINSRNPITICSNVNLTEPYRLDLVVSYTASSYVLEFYYIDNGTTSNETTYKDLYLLPSSLSTSFLFNYKDVNGLGDPEVVIHVLRKYIGDGVFREVETSKQDSNGETIVHLVEEDVIYMFNVTKDNQFQFLSSQYTAKCLSSPCSITLSAQPNSIDFTPEEEWDNIPQGSYSVHVNKSGRVVIMSFSLASSRLVNYSIYEFNASSGDTLVATSSVEASSGSISLDVPTCFLCNKTYYGVIYLDNEVANSDWIDLTESSKDVFGITGLFVSFLIILAFALIFVTEGEFMLVGVAVGVIAVTILHFMDLSLVALTTLICLIILLLYKLIKRRRIQ